METLFRPAVIDQASSLLMTDFDSSISIPIRNLSTYHVTLTSDYLNYKKQEVNQRKGAAILASIVQQPTGT